MTDEDRSEAIASTAGAPLRAYVALRENGRRLASAWGPGATALDAVLAATGSARDGLSPAEVERATALEVCVAHSFRPVPPARFRRELAHTHRGKRGIALRTEDVEVLYGPTEMLARNLRFERAIERFLDEQGLDQGALESEVAVETFEATQYVMRSRPEAHLAQVYRGSRLVAPEEVSRDSTARLAAGLKDWLFRNVHPDGRMTYKYWPSRGEESSANNMLAP